MAKLIMWNLISLDGYFEGPGHDIGWFEDVWGAELEELSIEQCQSASALLFGRVTYDLMASHWPTATGKVADLMNALPKIVASRTIEKADWQHSTVISENVPEKVEKLKVESDRDIYLFGSADLSASLIPHGLIDEYRICIAPLVLGSGTPLFKTSPERLQLELIDARPIETGAVIMRYRPA